MISNGLKALNMSELDDFLLCMKESLQKAVEDWYAGVVKTPPDDDDNVPDEKDFAIGAVLV